MRNEGGIHRRCELTKWVTLSEHAAIGSPIFLLLRSSPTFCSLAKLIAFLIPLQGHAYLSSPYSTSVLGNNEAYWLSRSATTPKLRAEACMSLSRSITDCQCRCSCLCDPASIFKVYGGLGATCRSTTPVSGSCYWRGRGRYGSLVSAFDIPDRLSTFCGCTPCGSTFGMTFGTTLPVKTSTKAEFINVTGTTISVLISTHTSAIQDWRLYTLRASS